MPSKVKRSRGLAARQADRRSAHSDYVGLVSQEARRVDLLGEAFAQLADRAAPATGDVVASMTVAVDLVDRGLPVAAAAAVFGLDEGRVRRAVRRSVEPASPSGKPARSSER